MKKSILKIISAYAVCLALGAAMLLIVLFAYGYFGMTDWAEKCKVLCDAFTVPGLLLMLFSALVFLSNHGAFAGIGYGVGRFFKMLIPFLKYKDETYAEYKERKYGNGGIKGYSCIFFSGLAYFLVSIALLIVYVGL